MRSFLRTAIITGLFAGSVNAQSLPPELCESFAQEHRLEPLSKQSLQEAMTFYSTSPDVALCIYPELIVIPQRLNEVENHTDWERGNFGLTLSNRIYFKLGEYEGEHASVRSSKGYSLSVNEIGTNNELTVFSIRNEDSNLENQVNVTEHKLHDRTEAVLASYEGIFENSTSDSVADTAVRLGALSGYQQLCQEGFGDAERCLQVNAELETLGNNQL